MTCSFNDEVIPCEVFFSNHGMLLGILLISWGLMIIILPYFLKKVINKAEIAKQNNKVIEDNTIYLIPALKKMYQIFMRIISLFIGIAFILTGLYFISLIN